MSTTLRATIEIAPRISVIVSNSDAAYQDNYRPGTSLLPDMKTILSDGTGSNQAQKHYHKAHTITASSSVTIDLTAAADERGVTHDFDKVKWMLIRLRDPATGKTVTVGNAATNQFSAWISAATTTESVSGIMYRDNPIDGWTVDATHKDLKIANPYASDVIVDVSIGGY